MRILAICVVLLSQFSLAQSSSNQGDTRVTAYCDFDDGQEIGVRYNSSPEKEDPRNGKVWAPGGSPMTLFAGSAIGLNNTTIPAGAYSVYVIPNKKGWTLIVNKNVNASAAYDEKQDVARGNMDLGEVNSPPKQLLVSFAHSGPKVCSIRFYYGKVGAFAELTEK